eukprot:9777471-Heterocapsa_arctica.AAC.1
MEAILTIPNWERFPSAKDSTGSTIKMSQSVVKNVSIFDLRVWIGKPPRSTPKSSCLRPHAPPRGL